MHGLRTSKSTIKVYQTRLSTETEDRDPDEKREEARTNLVTVIIRLDIRGIGACTLILYYFFLIFILPSLHPISASPIINSNMSSDVQLQ
ncbi:hypothetical protein LZ554_004008 [Drepanopeziza brunnea f. sp. 'monogermtubi']|nr:hypothetical protein LZ554_004008 [Drepanopeziza brunnea f. sp. 'monogermtubi']